MRRMFPLDTIQSPLMYVCNELQRLEPTVPKNYDNIEFMYSFEVDIRICQPENGDVQ